MTIGSKKLEILHNSWRTCTACPLGRRAFSHVFWRGSTRPVVVFVGEGPGRAEDALGLPFVGPAGKLLDAALDRAGWRPGWAAFTNLVACRPCNSVEGPNRSPERAEVKACRPRLRAQLRISNPAWVVAVGQVPLKHLRFTLKIDNLLHIHHPAFILRNGGVGSAMFSAYVDDLISLGQKIFL